MGIPAWTTIGMVDDMWGLEVKEQTWNNSDVSIAILGTDIESCYLELKG